MPKISMIVPVYKVEQYLHRCVDSILAQTYQDFELILVDDGSPDGCGVICDEYAKLDPRVVVIHQENGGLSAARNTGIDWAFANSDSQWLTFVDSDDFIHPEMLQRLLSAAVELGVDISVGGYADTAGEALSVAEQDLAPAVWDPEAFYVQKNANAVVAWGKLYRKELFSQLRYPVGRIHEDEFTTYKLLFACERLAVIAAPLYGYFHNPTGITRSGWYPARMDALDAIKEQIRFFKKRKNKKMVDAAACTYVWVIVRYIQKVQETQYDAAYRNRLKKELRKALLRYWRLFPVRENFQHYSTAFPRTMRCLRMAVEMIKKLFRRERDSEHG